MAFNWKQNHIFLGRVITLPVQLWAVSIQSYHVLATVFFSRVSIQYLLNVFGTQ